MQINLQGQHVALSETHITMTRNANIYVNEDYTELNRYYIEYCSKMPDRDFYCTLIWKQKYGSNYTK